jgi:tetratricopeptide (TPR) repeat protein
MPKWRLTTDENASSASLNITGIGGSEHSVIPPADTVAAQDVTVPPAESNTTSSAEAPADAAGYRRRGAALAGRGDLAGAIADLDQAIRLDPADPENFYQRALAHLRNRNVKLATADLDRAIELRATYVDALKERASLRFANHDEAGALADYDAVVGASPTDSGAELNIAKTYIDAGKYAGAVHCPGPEGYRRGRCPCAPDRRAI